MSSLEVVTRNRVDLLLLSILGFGLLLTKRSMFVQINYKLLLYTSVSLNGVAIIDYASSADLKANLSSFDLPDANWSTVP